MLQPLRTFFMLLLVPLSAQAAQSAPTVEVLIPKDMPIKIEAQRDTNEPNIVKYVFRRIVPKDARQAKITTVMLDCYGTVQYSQARIGNRLSDPMSLATGDTSIARILLVVEWLETDKGRWVPDTKTQSLDVESLIKYGAKALPRSKFIRKQ